MVYIIYGTTMYDFLLITAIVVDEYGEGVPIAWALSNRKDKSAIVHFLKSVQARVGSLSPNIVCLIVQNSITELGLQCLKVHQKNYCVPDMLTKHGDESLMSILLKRKTGLLSTIICVFC